MLERVRALSLRQVLLISAALAGGVFVLSVALFYAAGHRSTSDVDWMAVAKRQLTAVPLLIGYTMQFFLFLLPGACVVTHFSKRQSIPSHHILPAAIIASAVAGYAAFWVYFASHLAGKIFSGAFELSCAIYLFKHWKSNTRALVVQRDVALPAMFFFFGGLFYVAVLYLFDRAMTPDIAARMRFVHVLPPDNTLPAILAEKLATNRDPRPLSGSWLSSDRPPLQAGMVLLQRPFRIVRWNDNYQLLSTIYQAIWLPMIWALCRVVGYCERRSAWTLALCLLSGFFLINTVYVWPKLLAAALVVWAFALLWEPLLHGRKPSLNTAALAALSAALGFLSHGGVAFTLLALGLFFLIPRYFIGWKQVLVGSVVFLVAYFPWTLYQKYYDPPGNRLLKLYLAGVDETTVRGTLDAVKEAYSTLSAEQILALKLANVKLIGPDFSEISIRHWQTNQFFRILPAIGALNVGWIAFLLYLFRGRPPNSAERSAIVFVMVGLLSLVVWWVLLMGHDQAVIHQGSYATMILLFVGLSGCALFRLPPAIQFLALMVHACDFLFIWMFSTPRDMSWALCAKQLNLVMALALALSVFALILTFRRTRMNAPAG